MFQKIPLSEAANLPRWRRPVTLLALMAAAMPLAFATWSALLNNFVIEAAGFTGVEIGWLHTVREIPGFLAIGVIALIIFIREQVLGLISLLMLGAATAVTAWFPSFSGILIVTMISSIGFHYYETVNQSLQLQWIEKKRAPQVLGWIVAIGSGASLAAYGLLVVSWKTFDLSYNFVYLSAGGAAIVITLFCVFAYPQFESPTPQTKKMVLRRRYWLYYALQFMSGARRQIFVVFAGFMMVERFGFEVHEVTALLLINFVANMIFAPLMGKAVGKWGERNALVFEYIGLIGVFVAYAFVSNAYVAAALYVVDHAFFALAIAMNTYFQKIADPADMAGTAGVSFTINHIAAVLVPAGFGLIWLASPSLVFLLGAGMAAISFVLSSLIPRHPAPGVETVLKSPAPVAAE